MQTLIVEGRMVDVVRSFHDGVGNALLCEFPDGSWGYPNGERVKSEDQVSFVPETHRRRALRWVRSQDAWKNEAAKQDSELWKMTVPQLQLLANSDARTKAELIKIIETTKDALEAPQE